MNRFGLFILSYYFTQTLFAQTYPIPATAAAWDNTEVSVGEAPIPMEFTQRFEPIGDTLINSRVYAKLYRTWYSGYYYRVGLCDFLGVNPTYSPMYYCAIRSDESDKVYFIPSGDTSEILIYDFSLTEGDSINISSQKFDYYTHVIKVDSILIGDNYRKRLSIKGIYGLDDIWIEGVGSVHGLFATYNRYWEFTEYILTCYQENRVPLYISSPDKCFWCDLVTKIDNQLLNKRITIEPNPVSTKAVINIPLNIFPNTINVYNLMGKIIYSKKVSKTDYISIDRKDLTTGILIIEVIYNDNRSYRERIIVL